MSGRRNNPYMGPEFFTRADADLFFGRKQEIRDLDSMVATERLLLFYAPSGAGKTSLLNAKIVPRLEERLYEVLPMGRVSGAIGVPAGVRNVYAFNLMLRLAPDEAQPNRFAALSLTDFLWHLTTQDGEHYSYDESDQTMRWSTPKEALWPRVLILDQFEELVTTYPTLWRHREAFFRELDEAMHADPLLRVVLSLRSDFVQELDRYAGLLEDGLHARYHMLPLSSADARAAIEGPAWLFGRPFAAGVAEKLVQNLSQVREQDAEGHTHVVAGEWVEPIQLQVVCYNLWEKLAQTPGDTIMLDHLKQFARTVLATQIIIDKTLSEDEDRLLSGLVDGSLAAFYEDTLAKVLEDAAAKSAGTDERRLRAWFDKELITADGLRGTVQRNEQTGRTGSLANTAVDLLARRYLVRAELRAGGAWIELVHDRFVAPIRASNAAWFPQHLSALQRQAALWAEQRRSPAMLLRDAALADAEKWAADHGDELQPIEQEFLAESRCAQEVAERERRLNRRIRNLAIAAALVAILAIVASIWGWNNATLAQAQLDRQKGLALVQEARRLKEEGNVQGAIERFQAAKATQTDLGIDVETEIADVRRQAATQLTQQGEALAKAGDFSAAEAKFKAALALEPPPDTPVYVYIPGGEFVMGAGVDDERLPSAFGYDVSNEKPQQRSVPLDPFWIQRTEVTNAQYERCVEARRFGAAAGCEPPADLTRRYLNPQFAKQPVTGVTWHQAQAYAAWAGGRLPTEAQWEKACRGTDGRIFPWGKEPLPGAELLNFRETGLGIWSVVGSYPKGASPYGALDMAGNAWEWTSSASVGYPYDPRDGRENPKSGEARVLRGGSFVNPAQDVRCATRRGLRPAGYDGSIGFRVVVPAGF